jgi:hypothetical protein
MHEKSFMYHDACKHIPPFGRGDYLPSVTCDLDHIDLVCLVWYHPGDLWCDVDHMELCLSDLTSILGCCSVVLVRMKQGFDIYTKPAAGDVT